MKYIYAITLLTSWLAGIHLANGFFSTLFAFFCPLWAWYIFVEALVIKYLI